MVKGVNKKIIEVNNPDSIYFEKAVFYLKPEVRTLPDEIARREIDRYIADTGVHKKQRNSLKTGRIIILSALIAVTVLVIVTTIFL